MQLTNLFWYVLSYNMRRLWYYALAAATVEAVQLLQLSLVTEPPLRIGISVLVLLSLVL